MKILLILDVSIIEYKLNNGRIMTMARRKRQYESTRIKLDISFEEALAKLCNTTRSNDSTVDDDSRKSSNKEKPVKRN